MQLVTVIRGAAAPEELAAVVAVLAALGDRTPEPDGRGSARPADGYPAWRRTRLAALAQTRWNSTR